MLQLPDREFAAFIFDCDGTLVDTMPLHHLSWVESLRQHQAPYELSEDEFYSYAGIREQETVMLLNEKYGASLDPESVVELKSGLFVKRIPEVLSVPAVVAVAREWHGRVPMSVASGSEEHTVRACLETIGILELFDTIITPRDVKKGKPAPDMFMLAAERMGVDPAQCLVFEDGQSGLDAAKAAGMEAVFVARGLGRA